MKSSKGSQFEREFCTWVSLWWTNGHRDDIFWRSSNSGGRATMRGRKGKTTYNQYGDIQAVDPKGQPLLDLCAIELKRGYKDTTITQLIDMPEKSAEQQWEKFYHQVNADRKKAGVPFWMLITKRDRKEVMVCLPIRLVTLLKNAGSKINASVPSIKCTIKLKSGEKVRIFSTTINEFFRLVSRIHIEKVLDSFHEE